MDCSVAKSVGGLPAWATGGPHEHDGRSARENCSSCYVGQADCPRRRSAV